MADDFLEELGLEPDESAERPTPRQDKRLKDLSEKVKLTAEERDEKERLLQEQATQLEASKKEAEFYKTFNSLTTKYAGSAEHQDAIKEKVMAGYEVEDATVAVLAKEGKLPGQTQSPVAENPAGGSAANTITAEGEKSPSEMTQEERRAELLKNEGELNSILYPSR